MLRPDVDIHDVDKSFEALILNVLHDHRSGDNTAGINRKIFQEGTLFGG